MARFVASILALAEAERVHGVLVLRADFFDEVGTIIYEPGIQAIARGLFPAEQWPGNPCVNG